MKKYFIYLSLAFLVSLAAFSFVVINEDMDDLTREVFALKPYLVSPSEFAKPSNEKTILSVLQKMISEAENIHGDESYAESSSDISAPQLLIQLKESDITFRAGNKDSSLYLLRSTLGSCVSCHTQTPYSSGRFQSANQSQAPLNPFHEGEFLYLTHNYDEAMPFYNKAFAKFPSDDTSLEELEQILYRKLFYFIRIKKDLAAFISSMEANLENIRLPSRTITLVKQYQTAAKEVLAEQIPSFDKNQDIALKEYALNYLKEDIKGKTKSKDAKKTIRNIRLSGILHDYWDQNPQTNLKPEILYWLSYCESVPEMYLKKCALEFPQSSVAHRCLADYLDKTRK